MGATGIQKAKRLNKNEWRYFICTSAQRVIGEKRCLNRKSLKLDIVEQAVWDTIQRLLLSPKSLLEGYGSRRGDVLNDTQVIRAQIAALTKELASLEQKQNLLLELYLQGDLNPIRFS
ncbi:MAG: hypothetical protein HY741_23160 [Chloroflexi bacterium]|nr:hypothetical protein [Chloroflexota bacterium]